MSLFLLWSNKKTFYNSGCNYVVFPIEDRVHILSLFQAVDSICSVVGGGGVVVLICDLPQLRHIFIILLHETGHIVLQRFINWPSDEKV